MVPTRLRSAIRPLVVTGVAPGDGHIIAVTSHLPTRARRLARCGLSCCIRFAADSVLGEGGWPSAEIDAANSTKASKVTDRVMIGIPLHGRTRALYAVLAETTHVARAHPADCARPH